MQQYLAFFLSNLDLAEWLLQRRVARRRTILPSARWCPENKYVIAIHKRIRGVSFKKSALGIPWSG